MSYLARYGWRGLCRLLMDLTLTRLDRLVWKEKLRLVRRPVYIRGRNAISLGEGFTCGVGLRLDAFASDGVCLSIGKGVEVNDYVHVAAVQRVEIGDNVLIASKVFISDHNHGCYGGEARHDHPGVPPKDRPLTCAPVRIEDNVWIGEFVSVLPGVTIGKGSIIGANSVVTRSIPPYSIAVGSPARVVKAFDFTSQEWRPL